MRRFMIVTISLLVAALAALAQGSGPPQPTNLSAVALPFVSPPTVLLNWETPEGLWVFRVYRSVDDSLHFQPVGTTSVPLFVDAGLLPQTVYFYAVVTVDTALRESPRSSVVSVTTGGIIGKPTAILRGAVTDSVTGSPLPLMSVKIIRTSAALPGLVATSTDTLGKYVAVCDTGWSLLRVDQMWIGAGLPEYRSVWYPHAATPEDAVPVHLGENDTITADFAVARRSSGVPVHVRGTVRDTSGAPVPGATVAFLRTIQEMHRLLAVTGNLPGLGPEARLLEEIGLVEGVVWTGVTDSSGRYDALLLNEAAYIGLGSKQGVGSSFLGGGADPLRALPLVVRNDTVGVDLVLVPLHAGQGSVSGQVKSSTGEQVVSRVILFPRPNGTNTAKIRQVSTDQSGVYRVSTVEDASYSVMAVPYAGYAAAYSGASGSSDWESAAVLHVAGNGVSADVTVNPVQSVGGTELRGRAVDQNGHAIPGATLSVSSGQGLSTKTVGFSVTDGEGRFSIPSLPAGSVDVAVGAPGYTTLVRNVTIPEMQFTVEGGDFPLMQVGVVSVPNEDGIAASPLLLQNFPNPFNPVTTIRYTVGKRSRVLLTIHDLLGRVVETLVDEAQPPGHHEVLFRPDRLASGVYFYRLRMDGFIQTRSMVLLR